MPPDLRNHLDPTGIDTPTSTAASSLDRPAEIAAQKPTRSSRVATGGRPGDVNLFRPAPSERLFFAPIATSCFKVLRRPVETTQYVSIRYTERLAKAGIEPSVGSVGDAYDNALAETINGLYKTEVIRRRSSWKTMEEVELETLKWVDWFNHRRLLEPIGNIPPAEAEENYFAQITEFDMVA